MLEFGVSFLKFQALEGETLRALSRTLKNRWESEYDSSASEEDQTTQQQASILDSIGNLLVSESVEGSAEMSKLQEKALETLLSHSVLEKEAKGGDTSAQRKGAGQHEEAPETASRSKRKRRRGSSSAGRKKKPKTPALVPGKQWSQF